MREDDKVEMVESRVRLDLFTTYGLDRGRSKALEACWYLAKCLFFLTPVPWPSGLKCWILRFFGAKVGQRVVLKPRINIHMPWKLKIGDHTWIGEEAVLLNLEPIDIGSHVCISQRAFLCTGNHDFRDAAFRYSSKPIQVNNGAWIGAQVFVAAGCKVGADVVVLANSRVSGDLASGFVYDGIPARPVKPRWLSEREVN